MRDAAAPVCGQPLRDERRVDRLVQLARRIVGDVQQRRARRLLQVLRPPAAGQPASRPAGQSARRVTLPSIRSRLERMSRPSGYRHSERSCSGGRARQCLSGGRLRRKQRGDRIEAACRRPESAPRCTTAAPRQALASLNKAPKSADKVRSRSSAPWTRVPSTTSAGGLADAASCAAQLAEIADVHVGADIQSMDLLQLGARIEQSSKRAGGLGARCRRALQADEGRLGVQVTHDARHQPQRRRAGRLVVALDQDARAAARPAAEYTAASAALERPRVRSRRSSALPAAITPTPVWVLSRSPPALRALPSAPRAPGACMLSPAGAAAASGAAPPRSPGAVLSSRKLAIGVGSR